MGGILGFLAAGSDPRAHHSSWLGIGPREPGWCVLGAWAGCSAGARCQRPLGVFQEQ